MDTKQLECCYQGQKIAGCCYQGQSFLNDDLHLCFKFCFLLKQSFCLMNRCIQVEFDLLYKIASKTFARFPKEKREKLFFSANFVGVLLLGSQNLLAVVIRETNPNFNKQTPFSQNANFSAIIRERKANITPFERGDSKDYEYIKIFSIDFKIV